MRQIHGRSENCLRAGVLHLLERQAHCCRSYCDPVLPMAGCGERLLFAASFSGAFRQHRTPFKELEDLPIVSERYIQVCRAQSVEVHQMACKFSKLNLGRQILTSLASSESNAELGPSSMPELLSTGRFLFCFFFGLSGFGV